MSNDATGLTCLIRGNPADGFGVVELFKSAGFAESWGRQYADDEWWSCPLTSPNNAEDDRDHSGLGLPFGIELTTCETCQGLGAEPYIVEVVEPFFLEVCTDHESALTRALEVMGLALERWPDALEKSFEQTAEHLPGTATLLLYNSLCAHLGEAQIAVRRVERPDPFAAHQEKTVALSTAHLRQEDAAQLKTDAQGSVTPSPVVYDLDGGFLVYLDPYADPKLFLEGGYSADYVALHRKLLVHGYVYARLDSAAPAVSDLDTFSW